jgi:hypothetical protein
MISTCRPSHNRGTKTQPNICFCQSLYGSAFLCWTLVAFSVSCSFYTVGITPRRGDQPVARPLHAHRPAQAPNKRTQTSMPQVGFEHMIPGFERRNRVLALDRAATVINPNICYEDSHKLHLHWKYYLIKESFSGIQFSKVRQNSCTIEFHCSWRLSALLPA